MDRGKLPPYSYVPVEKWRRRRRRARWLPPVVGGLVPPGEEQPSPSHAAEAAGDTTHTRDKDETRRHSRLSLLSVCVFLLALVRLVSGWVGEVQW